MSWQNIILMNKEQFRTNRISLNLTQTELAKKLGYNQSAISRAEKGIISEKLAKAFQLLIESKRK